MMLILRQHLKRPLGALLIILQIAITLAIIANAMNMISARIEKIQRPSGLNESHLLSFAYNRFGEIGSLTDSIQRSKALYDLIRELPDVDQVVLTNGLPLHYSSNNSNICLQENFTEESCPIAATIYSSDQYFVETLGLRLIEGRNFTEEEVLTIEASIHDVATFKKTLQPLLITEAIAEAYFPNESAIGKQVFMDGFHYEIIGVIEQLQRTYKDQTNFYASVVRVLPSASEHGFVAIRAPQSRHQALFETIEKTLIEWDSEQVISYMRSFSEWRYKAYQEDRATQQVLLTVMALLLLIAMVGVGSLVSFSVIKQRKIIGTKRALGATRGLILWEMILENGLLVSIGCILGAFLAVLINGQLLQYFTLTVLDIQWVLLSSVVLMVLGQCVSFWPAWQATRISPAIATRTV